MYNNSYDPNVSLYIGYIPLLTNVIHVKGIVKQLRLTLGQVRPCQYQRPTIISIPKSESPDQDRDLDRSGSSCSIVLPSWLALRNPNFHLTLKANVRIS